MFSWLRAAVWAAEALLPPELRGVRVREAAVERGAALAGARLVAVLVRAEAGAMEGAWPFLRARAS